MLRMCTYRLRSSRTENTYRRCSVRAQSTWKKSQASMVDAWVVRNRRQVVWSRRTGAGGNAQSFEDPADRGRADPVAEAAQFALDALVAPAGIVAGHPLDYGGDGRVDRWPAGSVGIRPVAGDQPPMPAHDRGRGDESVCLQRPGE